MNIMYMLLLIVVLAFIAWRTIKDNQTYEPFKQIRSSQARIQYFKRWILESLLVFGSATAVTVVAAHEYIGHIHTEFDTFRGSSIVQSLDGAITSFIVALIGGLLIGVLLSTKNKNQQVVGDIDAMVPRNKQEIPYGAGLAINAGIVEELMFRLALPALFLAATGNFMVAIVASLIVFSLVHWYQGPAGIAATLVLGAIFMAIYLLTGNIVIAIVVHIVIDLRLLVLAPLLKLRNT